MTTLATIITDRVHHAANIAINEAIAGFIVLFVGTEYRVIANPITDYQVIIHISGLLHYGIFLPVIGPDHGNKFGVGG